MKDQSAWFSIIPIIFVVVVIIYEKKRQKKISNKYDEMQLRIRGKGAWYGYYVSVFYLAAFYILERMFDIHVLTAFHAVFLGVMISGSVIVGYSILNDSYFGLNWKRSGNVFYFVLIGAIDAVCIYFLVGLILDGVLENLKTPCMDERIMPVLTIPIFTTILITTLIRHMRPEEEEE